MSMQPSIDLEHPFLAHHAEYSPDGRFVLTAGGECAGLHKPKPDSRLGFARLWDAASGTPRTEWIHHALDVTAIAFRPDGRQFLTAGLDGLVKVFETESGLLQLQIEHKVPVADAVWSPDGQTIAIGLENKRVRLWSQSQQSDLFPPLKVSRAPFGHYSFSPLKFSPSGHRLAVCGGGQTVQIFEFQAGKLVCELKHRLRVTEFQWMADGSVLTASDEYAVKHWDAESGEFLREIVRTPRWISSLRCSRDGSKVLVGTEDSNKRHEQAGSAQVWEFATGRPLGNAIRHTGPVLAVFSPCERYVLSDCNGLLRLSNLENAVESREWSLKGATLAIRFHPAGKQVVAVGGLFASLRAV
jgi:WD40 repeat protein